MTVGEWFIFAGAALIIVTGINRLLVRGIAEGNAARLKRQDHIWPFTYFAGWDAARHEAFLKRWVIPAHFAIGVLLMAIGLVIGLANTAT